MPNEINIKHFSLSINMSLKKKCMTFIESHQLKSHAFRYVQLQTKYWKAMDYCLSYIAMLDFFTWPIFIFIMINFTSELSDCSTVHMIQSITGSMLDSPCFHSLWRSLSVSSHSLFGHIEFYSQKEKDIWDIGFNLVRDRNVLSLWSL